MQLCAIHARIIDVPPGNEQGQGRVGVRDEPSSTELSVDSLQARPALLEKDAMAQLIRSTAVASTIINQLGSNLRIGNPAHLLSLGNSGGCYPLYALRQ